MDAPLLGSMILAGVLLKLGGYGIYKIMVYYYKLIFNLSSWLVRLSIMGSIYTGVICLRQIDIKSIVAFSSIVHIGPVLVSFSLILYGNVLGGYIIMLSHGLCSSALFYVLNKVYL